MSQYSASQLGYAKEIVRVGHSMGMTRNDMIIALMVALDESELQNYANSKIPGSFLYPHDSVGSDGNSVGIFQQQVGIWGSTQELMDPTTEATKFYSALKNVPGRDTMTRAQAAQAVQRSATADGSNYAAKEPEAIALYTLIDSTSDFGGTGGTFPTTGGAAQWWADHGGWKRLGLYALGALLVWIALAVMVGESQTFQGTVKAAVKTAEAIA